jgi:hypothetical protein
MIEGSLRTDTEIAVWYSKYARITGVAPTLIPS